MRQPIELLSEPRHRAFSLLADEDPHPQQQLDLPPTDHSVVDPPPVPTVHPPRQVTTARTMGRRPR
nr:hypothetical protein [Dactylosporangium siamense]